jgi:hypothetical protein
MYFFISFGSLHTKKNIGCCIVRAEDIDAANEKCKELGLMPNECNEARAYPLDEGALKEQGMELNKFYSKAQMEEMGFQKA